MGPQPDTKNAPYWAFSKNMSVGVLISMVVYGVVLVNMISSMRSDIAHVVEALQRHESVPAHGDVRIALTGLNVRLSHIESWKAVGGRFTDKDGARLEDRIKKLEEEMERMAHQ